MFRVMILASVLLRRQFLCSSFSVYSLCCRSCSTTGDWSLRKLRRVVSRQYLRAVKKLNDTDNNEIDNSVNMTFENKRKVKLKDRVYDLQSLITQLNGVKSLSGEDEHYSAIMQRVEELNLLPPKEKPPALSKKSHKKPEPRKIYFSYISSDNIAIHVGKKAADNDELSCNPKYREDDEWWMHADGCAGSHVVIKSSENDILTKYPDTIRDAAILASFRSKNKLNLTCHVKLARCRNIKKIPGSPPGQVLLMELWTKKITVDMKKSLSRYESLEKDRLSRM